MAIGVSHRRERLCAPGGTPKRVEEVATALESSLAPDSRESECGEPVADIVAVVDVERAPYKSVEVVRIELTLAAGRPRDFLSS